MDSCRCHDNWHNSSDTQAALPDVGLSHICVEAWPLCWLLLLERSAYNSVRLNWVVRQLNFGCFYRYYTPKCVPQSEKITLYNIWHCYSLSRSYVFNPVSQNELYKWFTTALCISVFPSCFLNVKGLHEELGDVIKIVFLLMFYSFLLVLLALLSVVIWKLVSLLFSWNRMAHSTNNNC